MWVRCFYDCLKFQFPACHPVPQRPLSHQPCEEASFFFLNGSPALSFGGFWLPVYRSGSPDTRHVPPALWHPGREKLRGAHRGRPAGPPGAPRRGRGAIRLRRLWSTCERVRVHFPRAESPSPPGPRALGSHGPAVLSARASGPRALTAWHSSQLSLADVSILASPQDCLRGVSVLTSSADYAIDYHSIF